MDGGQRDVHDGDVEDDHELGQADHEQQGRLVRGSPSEACGDCVHEFIVQGFYPGRRGRFILVENVPVSIARKNNERGDAVREAAHSSERRRAELADFLRSRRASLQPTDVGLSNGGRRRTPGLRREEVAQLAGVGATWYTWLEQGRDVRASLDVLEALARALRLDHAERTHLVLLGGGRNPSRARPAPSAPRRRCGG